MDYSSSTLPGNQKAGEVSLEVRVANIGSNRIQIVRIENFVPEAARVTRVSPNAKVARGSIIPIRKNTPSMDVESFQFTIAAGKDPVIVKPNIVYVDENGRELSLELPPRVVASSPILDYLAKEFVADYSKKGLALEHSGWRTLTNIASASEVPRSHLYGEPRWGHTYGRPLEALLKSAVVECKTFPGERGRGGQILKARFAHATEIAKRYLEEYVQP